MSEHGLVVDAGHTRIKFAHCEIGPANDLPRVCNRLAIIDAEAEIPWSTISDWFAQRKPDWTFVTGTNQHKVEQLVNNWPTDQQPPQVLRDKRQLPLTIAVDFPERVGMDRLLNAIAANRLRQEQQPVICVDTGTAITVDLVDRQGVFQGGAILPGLLMSAKSLHEETTTLPHVNVWELLKHEPLALGKNTEAAIASGLYWGHLGAVRELVRHYETSLPRTSVPPLVLLTGGAAGILAPYFPDARHEPDLALQGLALAATSQGKAGPR